MARARNIKPAFFTNEQVSENCPLGRLLFIGLWTMADYKGDIEWKEKTLKIQILPWDECSLKQLAINLDKSGLIRFYSDGVKTYINIPNFEKHQNPHKNERDKGSEIPAYCESMRQVIDLKELAINPDKSRLVPESSHSDRADSLLLIPDSHILNPETLISADASCSEPIVSEPEDPPVIEILTNKKNELARITHSQYDRWVETYPAVDVWQTLLRIKSWAEANPAKRKTNKGMARFIDSWLAREQDKPRVNPGGSGTPQTQFKNSREKNAERNAQIFDYNRAIDF